MAPPIFIDLGVSMSSNTSDFTGADLIADALAQLEVEHVFAIVSIHNMPIPVSYTHLTLPTTPYV